MKIGLIGCGGMGTTHNECLRALAAKMPITVTAIADCRKEFLEKALNLWPDAKGYNTGEELISSEALDLVYICTPSYTHAALAISAMQRGMDIFVEKPVCLKKEDCDRLLEQHRKTPVNVMVGQVVRSTPEYLFLKKLYEEKKYGNLKSVIMQRISNNVNWGYQDWFHDPVRSGSVILDLHIHDIDFLRYMLGEPDYVDVHVSRFDSGMVNHIVSNYKFGSVNASVEGVWHIAPNIPFRSEYRVDFDNATVQYNSTDKDKIAIYTADGDKIIPEISAQNDAAIENGMNIKSLGSYLIENEYYLNCLLNNEINKRAPLEEGIRSVLLGIRELEMAEVY